MSNTDDGRWPTEAQMKARGPVVNDERVSFPRWWITRARDQLMAVDMPSGPLGDWVFLFREQLNDALNRPDDTTVAATPASAETDDELAEQIHKVAGCQVGSERTKNLIAWYRGKHAALAAPQAQEWQPIETAPQDGRFVDLWSTARGRLTDAYWIHEPYARDVPYGWGNSRYGRITDATHWMPLPDSPHSRPDQPVKDPAR